MPALYNGIAADFEEVTPEKAAEILSHNTHNRTLRERASVAYARDIYAGRWEVNGESIKIAKDGTLLDGQHRLAAIVESGRPITSLVVRGLPNRIQDNVDTGAKRRYGDVLQLRGETNATTLASVLRLITQAERGAPGSIGGGRYQPTNAEMDETLERYPWVRDGVTIANTRAKKYGLPGSVAGFTWWLFIQIDVEDAEFFFARLADGQNLSVGNPIYALRTALDNIDDIRGAVNTRFLTALVIKAWNAYRAGDEVKQLRFRPGGANPERFPEAK